MLKKDVVLRTEIRTVYSSEKQERMKVYFELSEKYEQCNQKCTHLPDESKTKCLQQCEDIFNEYANILENRYKDGNEERVNLEVQDAPIFTSKRRRDRDGLFYDITGQSFKEFIYGKDYRPRRTDKISDFQEYDDQNKYTYNPQQQQQQNFQNEADI